MSQFVIEIMKDNMEVAYILSLLFNIVISILAVIPSFFLTAANIYIFGFWEGTILTIVGVIIICFYVLFRKSNSFSNPTNK
jgi:uncharacterized membrane protein YdjX (TVP38/TMEM64 family)